MTLTILVRIHAALELHVPAVIGGAASLAATLHGRIHEGEPSSHQLLSSTRRFGQNSQLLSYMPAITTKIILCIPDLE